MPRNIFVVHEEKQLAEIARLRAALKEIYALQDRSFVSGEGKFMRAIILAREALTHEQSTSAKEG